MSERIRVLVADDKPEMREAVSALIEADPSLELVGAACDATEAIELATVHHPDVALIDVRMPGGGGTRATTGILMGSPSTRVIALSASDDRDSVLKMLQVGATGYLLKGRSVSEIVDGIQRSVRGERALAPPIVEEVIEELADKLRKEETEQRRQFEREERIRAVLDGSTLSVVFQPILDLRDGRLAGQEALTRFSGEPNRGPDWWFAEASAVGLRVELELLALRRTLDHLDAIPPTAYLSLNLSPETLLSPVFPIALDGAPLDRIVFEVTEHDAVEDYDSLNGALGRIRADGGRLAIDDAGAGFASLRHILRLSPDLIKIDMSLTRDIDTDRSRRALGAALISFAGEIGSTIVAEGIETESELITLKELGVSYGQGYYLARPAPVPDPEHSHVDA